MAAVQFTFTRIRSQTEGHELLALLIDDGQGRPELMLLPDELCAALRELAVDPAALVGPPWSADTAYGSRLCDLLVRSPALSAVQAYLLPYLGGAAYKLQLLFDVQDGLRDFDKISWELLAGLQRPQHFDALDLVDEHRSIARIVRAPSVTQLKLPRLPSRWINVLMWTPLRDDLVARSTAQTIYGRLVTMGDRVRPIAPPTSDLGKLARLLAADSEPAILHIITHGTSDSEGNVRILTDGGMRDALGLELQLGPLAATLREGRLLGVLLDVCHAGGGLRTESSPGKRLITAGFPFAIASETPLATVAAECFSTEFFRALTRGASIYGAVKRARTATLDISVQQPELERFAWARQRLYLTSALVRSAGSLLEQPVVQRTPQLDRKVPEAERVAARTDRFRLRELLLPRQLETLSALEFAVNSFVEETVFDGVRFGVGHLTRVEAAIDLFAAGLQEAANPLGREEAMALLTLLQLAPLGWRAVAGNATYDGAMRALLKEMAAQERAPAGEQSDQSELGWALGQLRVQVVELVDLWPLLQRTLVAFVGSLYETTRPFERPTSGALRTTLLAALLRVAETLDYGIHRLEQLALLADRPPTLERWLHTYSRRGEIGDGIIRCTFQIPDRTLLPIVELAAAAPLWADRRGTLDTLVQAGLAVCVLPPRISEQPGAPALRTVTGKLAEPPGLLDLLASHLCSTQSPRMHLIAGKDRLEQSDFAACTCSSVDASDNILKLVAPPECKNGGEVLFAVRGRNDDVLVEPISIELEPGAHLRIDCSETDLPVLQPLRWSLTVPRRLRSSVAYEGIFWILPEDRRERCRTQLARFDRCTDATEHTLARAGILRSHGCWSASLMLLNAAASQLADINTGLSMFAAMSGIYDRMLIVLSQLPRTEALAARVRTHQEAVWLFFHQRRGVQVEDHSEAARRSARQLLQAARMSQVAALVEGSGEQT